MNGDDKVRLDVGLFFLHVGFEEGLFMLKSAEDTETERQTDKKTKQRCDHDGKQIRSDIYNTEKKACVH